MTRARLLVLLSAVAIVAVATGMEDDGESGYRVRAEFRNAAGLRPNFTVKLGGVPVGEVKDVTLTDGDTAIATLELDSGAAPIGRDARAKIRPSNFLGEKYVELDPGGASRPAPSGTLIPLSRTATPTELDEVLNAFDDETRVALGVFLSEEGKALVGRGEDLAATLASMPPALDESRELIAELAHDNRALGRLIERSDRILATVARERKGLGRMVETTGGMLDVLASRHDELGRTISAAPAAVTQVRRSLVELRRAAEPLQPAARGLRLSAPGMEAMLRELPAFAEAARPALETVREVSPALEHLGDEVAPVLRRARPMARELHRFANVYRPASSVFDDSWADVLGVMEGWARAIQNRDGVSHVYRVGSVIANDVLTRLMEDYIQPEPARRNDRRDRSRNGSAGLRRDGGGGDRSRQVPDLRELPSLRIPPVRLPDAPDVHAEARDAPDADLDGVLDFLLGP